MNLRGLSALLAAALLSSCALFSGPSGPQPAPLTDIAHPKKVRVLWSAHLPGAGEYIFSPAVAGDAVYAAARDGTVVRLDARTGAQRWRVSAAERLSAGAGSDGRSVAVATAEGVVVVLDAASGKVRWRARVSSEVLAAPTVGQGLVLVRSGDARVFAFGEDDGERRWVYQRNPASLRIRSPAGVALGGDTAFVGFSGGKLAALSLANGGVLWEATVALPKGATELERMTDVVGYPAVEGREVCVGAYQGRVACYETATGRQTWARDVSTFTGVSVDARYAYVSDDHGTVQALDRSTGRPAWKQDRLSLRQLSLPVPAGEALAVGDFEGYVHFLARDSGALIARYATGEGAIRAAPVPLAGGWLIQPQDGELFALAL